MELNSSLESDLSLKSASSSSDQAVWNAPEQTPATIAGTGFSHGEDSGDSISNSLEKTGSGTVTPNADRSGSDRGQSSNQTPSRRSTSIPTPAPTPIPTPEPTPAPTPEFMPETFSCIACPPPAHYPRSAHLAAVGGSVQLRVDVSPEGWVMSATIAASSGSAELDQEAIVTVQNWQFTATAAGRYGVPVYVDFELE